MSGVLLELTRGVHAIFFTDALNLGHIMCMFSRFRRFTECAERIQSAQRVLEEYPCLLLTADIRWVIPLHVGEPVPLRVFNENVVV